MCPEQEYLPLSEDYIAFLQLSLAFAQTFDFPTFECDASLIFFFYEIVMPGPFVTGDSIVFLFGFRHETAFSRYRGDRAQQYNRGDISTGLDVKRAYGQPFPHSALQQR